MKSFGKITSLTFLFILSALAYGKAQTNIGKEIVLRLEASPDNPRNSEGSFITLNDGRILFVYTHFTAGAGDHASAFLAGRYSDDGGQTWTSQDEVILPNEAEMNIMSVSLLRMADGGIAMFYLRKNSMEDCLPMLRKSYDEAKTWSEPVAVIQDRKGYFILNNDRVVSLESGRWLAPVSLHQTPKTEWSNTGRIFCYYSDDQGTTWQSSPEVANPDSVMLQEPGVISLKNGKIMMFMRNDSGVQYLSYSKDGGETWSAAEPSDITSPRAPASIRRIPATGDLLLIWNNNGNVKKEHSANRIHYNTAISSDEGKTWQHIRTVADKPTGLYCYYAIEFVDDAVLVGHIAEWNDDKTNLSAHITRLELDWLYDGKSVSSPAKPAKEVTLSLKPSKDNPRNSEGSFVTLNDGRLLFVYTHFTGGTSDHAKAFLAGRYSDDGGKTWTPEDEVILANEGDMNIMSVSLLRLRNGNIAMFYMRKNSMEDCLPMLRISQDEAQTWSEPILCITDRVGYFVLNNDRVIQLDDGRLLMPVSLHQTPETEWSNTGRIWNYYSDDYGKTWTPSQEVANPDSVMLQEPGVVALKDDRIMMFMRNDSGVQYLSYSQDDGETWSAAEPSTIKSPVSPASIRRIPSTGDLLMAWNNNGGENEAIADKRTPFNVAISEDEGQTWEHIRTVEDDPDGWYCYTAITFADEHALLGHCAGNRSEGTGLAVTHITRLSLDWIYEKEH